VLLVYGDTNSTLAGALAASKLHIPIAHIEAGLRSFNMRMPEEVNRIVTDRISSLLFCPTKTAIVNLQNEGVHSGVYLSGDVMLDVTNHYRERADKLIRLDIWGVTENQYNLATIHRAENTDDTSRLISILSALKEISEETPVILPLHPRTLNLTDKLGIRELLKGIKVIDPVSYLPMTKLQMNAKTIITDSGGIQKEAFFHSVPCITLRDETEWTETVELGWNIITGADRKKILEAYKKASVGKKEKGQPYGDGYAADKILQILKQQFL
jgi:UDP-GlcNAc3NAcA epimerase